jgi:hypothetical protein
MSNMRKGELTVDKFTLTASTNTTSLTFLAAAASTNSTASTSITFTSYTLYFEGGAILGLSTASSAKVTNA